MDYGKKKRKKGPIPPTPTGGTGGDPPPPTPPGGTGGNPPLPTPPGGTGGDPPPPTPPGGTGGDPPPPIPPEGTGGDPPPPIPPEGTGGDPPPPTPPGGTGGEPPPPTPPGGTGGEPPKITIDNIDIELEFSRDRSYLYIFGPSTTGKTVLISSLLYYLKYNRSIDYGDTLMSLNDPNKKHEKEGSRLWNELNTTLFESKFPKGTSVLNVDNPIPRHINAQLLTSSKKMSDFKFCFIDMSGEELSRVNHDSNEKLPDVMRTYIKELPKENICFSYILDPQSDFLSKSEQINIFNGFIDLLDQEGHTSTPLLFLVSKWDLIAKEYQDTEEEKGIDKFLKKEFHPIWGTLNQKMRNISLAEFSIGDVNNEEKFIKKYDPKYAEKVFNWFYKNQTGDSLILETNNSKKKTFKDIFKK